MKSLLLILISILALSSAQSSLHCFYEDVYDMWYLVDYYCVLNIDNEAASDDFTSIPGPHPENLTNRDVTSLYGMAARENSVKIVPSVICSQFSNLNKLWLDDLAIEIVTDKSFQECHNLHHLYLGFNKLSEMPYNALWSNLNLRILDLGHNEFEKIERTAFLLLVNLEEIHLDHNKLRFLNGDQFLTNSKLKKVNLDGNQLLGLRDGTFGSLTNLEVLLINSNNLQVLSSKAFTTHNNLIEFQVAFNQISAIDTKIFDHFPTLRLASFDKNLCLDKTFEDFQINRDANLREFNECGTNFESSYVHCVYFWDFCILDIFNPHTRDDFKDIPGVNGTDSNVRVVYGESSRPDSVKIAPSIVCEKFHNLVDFHLDGLGIEFVTEKSFEGCRNLETLYLSHNLIEELPDDAFDKNFGLKLLDLGSNKIQKLSLNLINLEHFYIDNNPVELSGDFFGKMDKLKSLWMGSTGLQIINPKWFENTTNLEEIHFEHNKITQISPNTFDNLSSLKTIQLSFNHISVLSANAIPKTVVELHFSHNKIESIQRDFFNSMNDLALVSFEGNLCVDSKFENFNDKRDENIATFENCFTGYAKGLFAAKILIISMIFVSSIL